MSQNPSLPAPSVSASPPASRSLGRFELRALLGRSDVSMAWRAFDPKHSIEVTLVLPRAQLSDPKKLMDWQSRLLAASRLSHPHVATMLDFGVEARWPYVSFSRSLGVTLSEWLAGHPPPTPEQSMGWMCAILEALAYVHDAGFSHGDVEPFTVLLNDQGSVRLIGLGLPMPTTAASGAGSLLQSSSLVSQSLQQAAKQDVLAVGLLLQYLLSGQMPLGQTDVAGVIAKMASKGREAVRLPRSTPSHLSEPLRLIANRAVSDQERQRFTSARIFRSALAGLLEKHVNGFNGPLEVLRARVKASGYLPAGQSVMHFLAELQSLDPRNTGEIAEQIMDDPALTLEILRQVNQARLAADPAKSNEPVIKVRRAVALLGINGISRCVQSLKAWPASLPSSVSESLVKEMNRCRLAGRLAQLLAPPGYDPEMVYLVTMMQNLGRFLVCYHFAEEAEQIRQLMQPEPPLRPGLPELPGLSEDRATQSVLGVEPEELALEVVKDWGLGNEMIHMMSRVPPGRVIMVPGNDSDWLKITASAANEAVDVSASHKGPGSTAALNSVVQRFGKTLEFDFGELASALKRAKDAEAGDKWFKNSAFVPSMLMDLDD